MIERVPQALVNFWAMLWFHGIQRSKIQLLTPPQKLNTLLQDCCAQLLWIKQQLSGVGHEFDNIPIKCDNTSAICITKNPVFHFRTKYIEVRHHFIKDNLGKGNVSLEFVNTESQVADIFIKPLGDERFNTLRNMLGLLNSS